MSDRLWGFFHHISQRIIRAAVTEATRPGQPALSRMYSAAGGGGGHRGEFNDRALLAPRGTYQSGV